MNQRIRLVVKWTLPVVVVVALLAGIAMRGWWMPASYRVLASIKAATVSSAESHDHDDEGAASDHDHEAALDAHEHDAQDEQDAHGEEHDDHEAANHYDHVHDAANSLELSQQAAATLGLALHRVELRPFARTVNIPGAVVQRPGTSQVQVTAPFTGVIMRIYHVDGEAVLPGTPLFDLRLTHADLVEGQSDFLQMAEQLAVVDREVNRLREIAASGVIAGKTLLEREYEKQKIEASLRSQRQRLLLHGLPEKKIDEILSSRRLLQELTITAPQPPETEADPSRLMKIGSLKVEKGQQVAMGDPLCELSDYAVLFVQGKAFEQDIAKLTAAAQEGWPVTAVFELNDNRRQMIEGLKILYLANEVEVASRAFSFYVPLPNEIVRDSKTDSGQHFVDWRFRPGQRARLLVPVEPATPRIVLPVEAVVQDGPESYVFEHNGGHFDRRAVHVEYRDQDRVVIANDGTVKPGVEVATASAYQLQLATKNKTVPPLDPHAGHNH